MSLILGTNAYIELAQFKAWCDIRTYSYASFTDEAINGAIVVSSLDFVDPRYVFKGDKVDSAQAMNLPTNEVPIADIESGIAQAVYQQLNGQLFVDLSTIDVKGSITAESKKLAVMDKSVEYSEGSRKTKFVDTSRIDDFMDKYTTSNNGGFSSRRTL